MVKKKGKKITGVPPPPKTFLFVCETCGVYPTMEEITHKFLTDSLRSTLNEKLEAGAVGAKLTFKGGKCPRCHPEGVYLVESAALWPRKVH